MRFIFLLLFTLISSVAFSTNRDELYFIENKGQIIDAEGNPQPNVLFTLKARGVEIFITKNSLHYFFNKKLQAETGESLNDSLPKSLLRKFSSKSGNKFATHRLDLFVKNTNPNSVVKKGEPLLYYENYYNIPSHPSGILKVRTFDKIVIENIYDGIDWVLYVKGSRLKYDFVVHQGGDYEQIKMQYEGANEVALLSNNSLSITTPLGSILEEKPFTFLTETKEETPSSFVLYDNNTIGFRLPQSVNEGFIIDPGIIWSTYYGGHKSDHEGLATCTDNKQNVYLSGITGSTNHISSNGHQDTLGGNDDAFLVKFDSNGVRQWATYYGGVEDEDGHSVATDKNGNVYLTGSTNSTTNIASSGVVHQDTLGGYINAFLVKFDSNGIRQWGTYYGGENYDHGYSVCTDNNNNVYLSGKAQSKNGIGYNGFLNSKPHWAGYEAFLVKFNSSGVRQWGTYYGGTRLEEGRSVCVDNFGGVYLAGFTTSYGSIAYNGHQNSSGGLYDIFLVKFDTSGVRQWGTFYGGSGQDLCFSAATDKSGNIYLTGWTNSTQSFSYKGFQNNLYYKGIWSDAFVVKFTRSGLLKWATYYGGETVDVGLSICTDTTESVYISGYTQSENNIAYGSTNNILVGGESAFLLKLSGEGEKIWSQYLRGNGGKGIENGWGLASDLSNNVYMAGTAKGGGTTLGINGHSDTAKSYQSAFLTKFFQEKVILNQLFQTSFCPGDSLTIRFTKKISTSLNNKYVFQLSDSSGYFLNDTSNVLISIADSTIGVDSIKFLPSLSLQPSNKYKLRLFSTSIADTAYYQDSITVYAAPNTSFTSSNNQCGLSDSVSFISNLNKDSTIIVFQWNFGDSSISDSISPIKSYSKLGEYIVQLIATTDKGCSSSSKKKVLVNDVPKVAFDINKPSQCLRNNKFIFTNQSTIINDSLNFKWNFGDLSKDSVASPQKSYNGIGVFDVKLIAVSKNNCIDSLSKAVVVNVHPYVNIKTLSNDECQGKTARFEASIKDSTNSYFWFINGVQNSKDSLNYYETHQPEAIFLVQKNKEGCYDTSATVNSIFKPLPTKPILSQTNKELDAGAGYASYQWYRNGNQLNGEVSRLHSVTQIGDYHCKVTNNDSCENWSDTVNVINTHVSSTHKDNSFRVYPNPSSGEFILNFGDNIEYKKIYLTDISGRILFQGYTYERYIKLDFRRFSGGIYFLEATIGDTIQSQKIMIKR
jgi:hypothetical protein